jgi:flagellin-like protein
MKKRKEEKKMNFRQLRKNVKAISPIISVLLMIAVAVVAALVTYAWVMGFIGFQTGKTGKAIQIQSMAIVGGKLTVYVQNVGDSMVSFSDPCVYVNGTATTGAPSGNFNPTTTATFNTLQSVALGDTVTVKVASADGTFSQKTQTFEP